MKTTQQPGKAEEVLNYFFRNPQAAATLEDVARWRLMQEAIRRGVEKTAQALEWLVAEGYLTKTVTPFSKPVYSLNPEEMARAARLLGRGQTTDERGEQN